MGGRNLSPSEDFNRATHSYNGLLLVGIGRRSTGTHCVFVSRLACETLETGTLTDPLALFAPDRAEHITRFQIPHQETPLMPSEDDPLESSDARKHSSSERDLTPTATTDEAFQEALRALVLEAESNGVDVRGGWPIVRGDETKRWDVEITSVARSSTAHVDETGSAVASIVAAVADREGVETTDLPPLQETIDHKVLETLQQSNDEEQYVRFQYYGYEITVRADGSLILEG